MDIQRRDNYRSTGLSDAFIVPILDFEITNFIKSITIPTGTKLKVLDIGCGEQPYKQSFIDAEFEYFSLDIAQNKTNNVDFICKIDEKLPDDIEKLFASFDLLFLTEVLEHVFDWEIAFTNISMLAKPKALIFITTPFIFHLHEEPFDYWRPTSHAIQKVSEKVGMKVVSSKKAGTAWDVIGSILAVSTISIEYKNPLEFLLSLFLKSLVKLLHLIIKKTNINLKVKSNSLYYLSTITTLVKK